MHWHLKKWQLPITVVCLFSGIFLAITMGLQSQQEINPVAERNNALVTLIRNQEKTNRRLEQEIQAIREELLGIQKKYSSGRGDLKVLSGQLENAHLLAGLYPVQGPGIVITINDQLEQANAATKAGLNPEAFLIHYLSLLNIVNDLKYAGAEAIAINGVRLVTPTDIRCAGVTISVNQVLLGPPYEIKAIGDSGFLSEMVQNPGTDYSTLKLNKFPVSIEQKDELYIPAYKGSLDFNYAGVVKGERN